jgi:hypothetical protein
MVYQPMARFAITVALPDGRKIQKKPRHPHSATDSLNFVVMSFSLGCLPIHMEGSSQLIPAACVALPFQR